jgi:hypothetical protein
MLNKKHLFWLGVATLGVLIVYNSTKKNTLKEFTEVKDTQEQKSFDNSTLPSRLQPPYKMADGEPMPQKFTQKRILGLNAKPRFDAIY